MPQKLSGQTLRLLHQRDCDLHSPLGWNLSTSEKGIVTTISGQPERTYPSWIAIGIAFWMHCFGFAAHGQILGIGPAPELLDIDGYPAQVGYVTSEGFVDADAFLEDQSGWTGSHQSWQILPSGLIYKTYLANTKEPRLAARIVDVPDDSTFFDANVGARVGLIRFGTSDPIRPEGFQIDAEGAAQVRLDIPEEVDVRAADFRGGLVATWGNRYRQTKFGYYHLSSHLGDEFLIKNPDFDRLNFARDVLVLGKSIYFNEWLRFYGEAGWAFFDDISEPLEFQFGFDYAPVCPTGLRGAPFFAANAHLREEVNFGGNISAQLGWAWRGSKSGSLLRMGFHYYNGESSQFSFYDDFEQQFGFGVWYDR